MREEIRRGEALDDAALEGVSGGIDQEAAEIAALRACEACSLKERMCGGSRQRLAAHMVEHDVYIRDWSRCPFYGGKAGR